jgi:hypothetical protein
MSASPLREMNALYRSPYTVNPGHFQIETYAVGYVRDRSKSENLEIWRIAPSLIRAGILDNLDVQVGVSPFTEQRTTEKATGQTQRFSGFGDVSLGTKWNLAGNDDGAAFAIAILPSVKFPTSAHGIGATEVTPSLAVPVSIELIGGWWLGVSPEATLAGNVVRNAGTHWEFASTSYLWHVIYKSLSGYVEFSSWMSEEDLHHWWGTFDMGLTWAVTANLQLDIGVLIGMTDAAPDLNPFFGISVRF